MTQFDIAIGAKDEDGRKLIEAINAVPQYTAERAEIEAHFYVALARAAWRDADRLRALDQRREKRGKR